MGDAMPDAGKVVVYVHEIPVAPEEVEAWIQRIGDRNARVSLDENGDLLLKRHAVSFRDGRVCEFSCPNQATADVPARVAMEERLHLVADRCAAVQSGDVIPRPGHPWSVRSGEADLLVTLAEFERMVEGTWGPDMPSDPTSEQLDELDRLSELAGLLRPSNPTGQMQTVDTLRTEADSTGVAALRGVGGRRGAPVGT